MTQNLSNLAESLSGLENLGSTDQGRINRARALDSAWVESKGSVVAFSKAIKKPFEEALNTLSSAPFKAISKDDPRHKMLEEVKKEKTLKPADYLKNSRTLTAVQERQSMKILENDPGNAKALANLKDVVTIEQVRSTQKKPDLTR